MTQTDDAGRRSSRFRPFLKDFLNPGTQLAYEDAFKQPRYFLAYVLQQIDGFALFCWEVVRGLLGRPVWWREAIQQTWVLFRMCAMPIAILLSLLIWVVAVHVIPLLRQLGVEQLGGAVVGLAILRLMVPLGVLLALTINGCTVIATDLGIRQARQEIDALRAVGTDPIRYLVVPRVVACVATGLLLASLTWMISLGAYYAYGVFITHISPALLLSQLSLLVQLPDLFVTLAMVVVISVIAGVMSTYAGLSMFNGPRLFGAPMHEVPHGAFLFPFLLGFVLFVLVALVRFLV